MSQRIRRSLAMAGLAVALFMAVPAPSQAAGRGEETGLASFLERILEGWVEIFLPERPSWNKQEPTAHPGNPPEPGAPARGTNVTGDQGSVIDPDGVR